MTADNAEIADALTRRRSLPPGGMAEMRAMSDGWPVRTMSWQPGANAPGSILFLGGRADFIEKYSEALWAWSKDFGAGLVAVDWRGQGLSGRLSPDRMKGHTTSFDRWVDDLDTLVDWFVATMPGPHLAVGHSMGGHLLTRHLARRTSPLSRAVLLAPMFGLRVGLPLGPMAHVMVALGQGDRFAPMQRPYGAWQQRPERRGLLTSDLDRFTDEHWWIAQNPDLAIGGVTWGWIDAAETSLRSLAAAGALEGILQPTLALSGDQERLVSPDATRRAMARIPGAHFEVLPGAAHELLRETPTIQLAVHRRIQSFLFDPPA